jgi:hypothetical protein
MKSSIVLLAMVCLLGLGSIGIACSRKMSKVVQGDETPRWIKTEIPLTVDGLWGQASAEGFWQSTSTGKDKQLLGPIAVTLRCNRDEKICREADAAVVWGILSSGLVEYEVSTWTDAGIIADDHSDEGVCGIAHRLSIDFKTNSVTVTDYPLRVNNSQKCKPFQDANSYSLHGGQLQMYPPARWNPLEKKDGKK